MNTNCIPHNGLHSSVLCANIAHFSHECLFIAFDIRLVSLQFLLLMLISTVVFLITTFVVILHFRSRILSNNLGTSCKHWRNHGAMWAIPLASVNYALRIYATLQGVPKKRYPCFYFYDNIRKWTPILTIFSLLEPEIYDALK